MIKNRVYVKKIDRMLWVKGKNLKTNEHIRKAMASVHASMAIEGLEPSQFAMMLGKKYFKGEITGEEAIARIKARYFAGANIGNE